MILRRDVIGRHVATGSDVISAFRVHVMRTACPVAWQRWNNQKNKLIHLYTAMASSINRQY